MFIQRINYKANVDHVKKSGALISASFAHISVWAHSREMKNIYATRSAESAEWVNPSKHSCESTLKYILRKGKKRVIINSCRAAYLILLFTYEIIFVIIILLWSESLNSNVLKRLWISMSDVVSTASFSKL